MKKILFFILFFTSFPLFSITNSITQVSTSISKVETSEFKSNILYTLNTNWIAPNRLFINSSLSILSNKKNKKKINWIPISVGVGKYFKNWYIFKPFTGICATLSYINKQKNHIEITPTLKVGTLIKTKNYFGIILALNQHLLIHEKNIRHLSFGISYTLTPKNYKGKQKPSTKNTPSKRLKSITIKQSQKNE